ncbi:MAG: hypothetical protein FWD60_00965 [Candidatus Azobacteroides sp.]|nr:hypothetical protein [Candidatus Azobacteroides sp.]
MVFYSEQADNDLDKILEGLLYWNKIELSREFCLSYINDIIGACDCLDTKIFHSNAVYETHRQYGNKVHTYKRNANTIWYIIYNKIDENIYVEKIISNYITVS